MITVSIIFFSNYFMTLYVAILYGYLFIYYSDAFDMHYGVGILRLAEGLDYSQFAMASYGDDCK